MEEINELLGEMQSETQGKYLTFAVGEDDYALEIDYVTEIIGMQAITEVPEIPTYIKGLINLRGKITPVMDVRLRFNKPPQEYNDRTCIIVVVDNQSSVGLIVDTIRDVLDISDGSIGEPAATHSGVPNRYIKGIAKTSHGVKLLINLEKVLSDR